MALGPPWKSASAHDFGKEAGGTVKRAAAAEYGAIADALLSSNQRLRYRAASESATVLSFQRFRCVWWGGRTERQANCGYVGGFTNRLAADPLFKSKPSAIRLKQNLPKCL